MHINWKHLAIALAVLPFVVLLAAWIGFFNVGASAGHWKITEWFLHFAMRSAIRTYALTVEVPEKLPREAIQPAAAHFARGCAICHGAPGEARSPAVLQMLPQPPDLTTVVNDWTDAELFRIVKHGVRFTGMPAWPVQTRDDEVWAMVAFLRELPAMPTGEYRNLAHGRNMPAWNPAGFEAVVVECALCHGDDGRSRSPMTPIIAGQSETYLLESLRAYARGDRPSGFMSLPATAADSQTFAGLARHFATLQPAGPTENPDVELAGKGEAIARNGLRARNIPACLSCHGDDNRNLLYPSIAGQSAGYIQGQLKLFRMGNRGGTPYSHIMIKVAEGLSDADIAALAAHFSRLPWPPRKRAD